MDQVRARLETELFDDSSRPARLGRFVVLEKLGQGGVGSVYAAYDPELDRRVALKVLVPELADVDAHDQLKAEARSLAKLSHPNVVPVHDVVDIEERVVLVMELVQGCTVYEWQTRAPRSWREVLEVYTQIADGLSAAHTLGIVHRDVKPQNAIVGDDGRVRVVDFGLARFGRQADGLADGPVEIETLTATGKAAGTPAYMSPEQFEGKEIGPASDQFSFCVALYRALYDARPFSGDNVEEIRAAVTAAELCPPPRDRSVPRSVQAALITGLERAPEDRHASMDELCSYLRRDPAKSRRRAAGLGAVVALLVLGGWGLMGGSADGVAVCSGGPDRLESVWDEARRASVGDRLALHGAYGRSVRANVLADLDRYGERFVSMHRSACLEHQRGEQSAVMLDKRMQCLDRRLDDLDGAVTALLEIDATGVKRARDVVADLPPLADCADTEVLAAAVPLPDDPQTRARVEDLERRLSSINALEHIGRLSEALERAKAIAADAEAIGYPPVQARAQLAVGRIQLFERAFEDASSALRRAEALGLEHELRAVAIEATARRLYVDGALGERLDVINTQYAMVEPLSRGLADGGFARALLLNSVGVAHMAHGQPKEARQYFEQARDEISSGRSVPIELQAVIKNLAMVTPEAHERRQLAARAHEQVASRLGDNHHQALEFASGYAHYVANPTDAYRVLKPTCQSYATYHPDQEIERFRCLYYQSFLELELGLHASALETMEAATRIDPASWDEDDRRWHDIARASLLRLDDRPRDAAAILESVIARVPAPPRPWWLDEVEGHARLELGAANLAAGRYGAADKELAVAAEKFTALCATNQDVENRQRLALARLLRARALEHLGERARASGLARRAASWYREVSPTAYAARLAAISK